MYTVQISATRSRVLKSILLSQFTFKVIIAYLSKNSTSLAIRSLIKTWNYRGRDGQGGYDEINKSTSELSSFTNVRVVNVFDKCSPRGVVYIRRRVWDEIRGCDIWWYKHAVFARLTSYLRLQNWKQVG